MKLQFDAHVGYLFTELPLEERIGAAARAGFRGVEHPSPFGLAAPKMAALLREAGVPLVQMALPAGDASRGEKGLAIFPDRRSEFRESVARGLEYAESVGCKIVHVMAGIRPADCNFEHLWECYIDNLEYAAAKARERGIAIVIEAIGPGTIRDYALADPIDALKAIDLVGINNVFLMFDTFHAARAGYDPVAFVRDHYRRIRHLQIADFPGRNEPGTGTLDFPRLFRTLELLEYAGHVGCEYLPSSTTGAGLGWLCRTLTTSPGRFGAGN